jgi:hypothetical protein
MVTLRQYGFLALFTVWQYQIPLICLLQRIGIGLYVAIVYCICQMTFNAQLQADLAGWQLLFLLSFSTTAFSAFAAERNARIMHNVQLVVERQHALMIKEQACATAMLENILPSAIVVKLKRGMPTVGESFEEVII